MLLFVKKRDIHTRQISTISFPARMCLDVQGYEKFVTAVGPLGAKLHIALHYSGQCVPPDPANSTDDVGFMILRIFLRLSATTYPACRPTVSPSVQKRN